AAESIGIPVTKYKLLAFSVSASLAGVAGVLYAHNLATLNTKKFDYNTSILILVFVVLGGIGNMTGSMIAAVILTALPEMLRFLNNYRMLIYAIVLIVIMLFNWAPASLDFRSRMRERLWKKHGSDAEGGR
ncbi:MAG: branched-chain amino acid ABC transporter permease, partial [Blautia sp.]|nr:branched-chain amino acid ABC transporter permease [Blautia sp.]